MDRLIKVTSIHILQKSKKKQQKNKKTKKPHDLPCRFRLCSGKGKHFNDLIF